MANRYFATQYGSEGKNQMKGEKNKENITS